MGRQDFGRTPLAHPVDDDTVYIGSVPDGSYIDQDSPMGDIEVGKYVVAKENSRRRGMAVDYDPATFELKVLAFFNRVTIAMLAEYLRTARAENRVVKSMSLLLDVDSSREMIHELTHAGFVRDESCEQPLYWIWRNLLTRKKKARVVDVKKDELKPVDLKPTMTAQQYADKQVELERLKQEVDRLERLREKDSE